MYYSCFRCGNVNARLRKNARIEQYPGREYATCKCGSLAIVHEYPGDPRLLEPETIATGDPGTCKHCGNAYKAPSEYDVADVCRKCRDYRELPHETEAYEYEYSQKSRPKWHTRIYGGK